MSKTPEEILKKVFGLKQFRPHQREVVGDVLDGEDVLCVMPTGAGKSLCFQLPAIAKGGLTIIVSPLISLMADQVAHLKALKISAMLLNSSQTIDEQRAVIKAVANGFAGLLYVAPERFSSRAFQWLMPRIKPKLFVVDEAHCVSFWGHDFRPEYMRLGEVRRQLKNPVTIAVTATATRHVQRDIINSLALDKPRIHVTGFDRPNLIYATRRFEKDRDKDAAMLRFLETKKGSGIVYCATRRAVEEITALLEQKFRGRTIVAYHAGMSQKDRKRSQEDFMETDDAIAVATNAFGMGINKPDTRFVLHYNLPGSLEAYYQEAGRAGRDGKPAHCLLYFSGYDMRTQQFFIQQIGDNNSNLQAGDIVRLQRHARSKLDLLIDYATEQRCRRQQIIEYFGEKSEVEDCNCDVCELQRSPHRYSPIHLTATQTETIVRKLQAPLEKPARSERKSSTPKSKASLDSSESARFERLRTWRLELARERGWRAFRFFHDATLQEIARTCPRNMRELLEIPGIGPKKAEEFGDALLAELRNE